MLNFFSGSSIITYMDDPTITHKNKYHDEMLRLLAQLSYNAGVRDADRNRGIINYFRNLFKKK